MSVGTAGVADRARLRSAGAPPPPPPPDDLRRLSRSAGRARRAGRCRTERRDAATEPTEGADPNVAVADRDGLVRCARVVVVDADTEEAEIPGSRSREPSERDPVLPVDSDHNRVIRERRDLDAVALAVHHDTRRLVDRRGAETAGGAPEADLPVGSVDVDLPHEVAAHIALLEDREISSECGRRSKGDHIARPHAPAPPGRPSEVGELVRGVERVEAAGDRRIHVAGASGGGYDAPAHPESVVGERLPTSGRSGPVGAAGALLWLAGGGELAAGAAGALGADLSASASRPRVASTWRRCRCPSRCGAGVRSSVRRDLLARAESGFRSGRR